MAKETDKPNRWRSTAGSLELFLGAYFVACGCLAILFFLSLQNRDGALLSAVGLLFGILLIFRAAHLLAWRPWIFRSFALILILAPVIWVAPAFLSGSDSTSELRYRGALAAGIHARSTKAHDLSPLGSLQRFEPDVNRKSVAYQRAAALRDSIQGITADTFVWCMRKAQSIMHGDTAAPPPAKKDRRS